MKISLLRSEQDNSPVTETVSWDDVVKMLSNSRETDCSHTPGKKCDKRVGLSWSPTWFEGGRKKANAKGMSVLVYDVDHVKLSDLEKIDSAVKSANFSCILHSTHSNNVKADDLCVRIIIDLSRPLAFDEIRTVRANVAKSLNIKADPATEDEGRIYFRPSHPKGTDYIFETMPGRPVPVDEYLAEVARIAREPAYIAPSSNEPVDISPVQAALKTRNANEQVNALKDKVLRGEVLAMTGGRDQAVHQLMSSLAFSINNTVSVDGVLAAVAPSIEKMEPPERGTWLQIARAKFENSLRRWNEDRLKNKEMAAAGELISRRASAQQAPDDDSPERVDAYTAEQLEVWAASQNVSPELFQRRWVIQYHGVKWIWHNGKYSRATNEKDFSLAIRDCLSRAPIALYHEDKNGHRKMRGPNDILQDYGTVASSVEVDLSLQESYFDGHTFNEAIIPRRKIKPVFDPAFDEWCQLLTANDGNYKQLRQWLAAVPQLDRQLSILYFQGPKSVGKNVLAQGLSRLWVTTGPGEAKNVFGSAFNEEIVRCPLVFADETLPDVKNIVDELRQLIGTPTRTLNRKFMPVIGVRGNLRLLIAANNPNVIRTEGLSLTAADIDALNERLFPLECDDNVKQWVEAFRAKNKAAHDAWYRGDVIAAHCLWLMENEPLSNAHRFVTQPSSKLFVERMATTTGAVGGVLEFLARFLSSPDTAIQIHKQLLAGGGRLLVNTELLADKDRWERFVPSRKVPGANQLSRALRQISKGKTVTENGLTFHEIIPDMLLNWAIREQVGEVHMIRGRMGL